jgi:hypothetical protein
VKRYNLVHAEFTTIQVAEYGRFVYAKDVEDLITKLLVKTGEADAEKALHEIAAECRQAMKWQET